MAVTAGTVRAALGALQGVDLAALQGAVSSHLSNIADDATVAEDVLAIIGVFFPAQSLLIALATVAIAVAARGIADGSIRPGASGEGQTSRNFNPGDPAARLVP